MKILFLCGREPDYPRNQIHQKILDSYGEVDLVAAKIKTRSIIVRSGLSCLEATVKLIKNHYDLVYIGFFGQFLVPLIAPFIKSPLLFDAFISAYDTLVFDRKMAKQNSLFAKAIYSLDKVSCNLSDRILLDTHAHVRYFVNTFGLHASKFDAIPVGCDDQLFFPRDTQPDRNNTIVLFYGSFLPIHGLEIIVRAAKLLENRPITFRIIGSGMEYDIITSLAHELRADNIQFFPSIPLASLPKEISRADICLGGHFGPSEKAKRVIAGKTYQCIAMGKPVIVGDNDANRELLTHNHDAWFCKMGDPTALADAIRKLADNADLRKKLATNARLSYLEKASPQVIFSLMGQTLAKIME